MESHLIHVNATILDALGKLNELSGRVMTLFVVDDMRRMLGTVTDGDIRRAMLAGADTTTTVDKVMHRDFRFLRHRHTDVEGIRRCRAEGIRLLPCIDTDGVLMDIIDLSKQHTVLPLSAVLMAGGKGERLRPLTLETPKPLLKIGEKAIIDYNIEALARCGVSDIWVTVNYLADRMFEHFSRPVAGVKVRCVEEEQPLGTIGAAALCPIPAEGYTIVMNSDLLTTISFEDMYLHHIAEGADITVAAVPYQVSVPFAILSTDSDDVNRITSIEEKPSYSYIANAGIYLFPNSLLHALRTDRRTDATDLIASAIASGMKVSPFLINGTWIDVGSPADFRQASELIKSINSFNSE